MSDEERNIYKERIVWRETIREPRLVGFDARIVFFFLLLAAHLAWWTFGLLCSAAVVFLFVEKAGYRFPSALRAIRSTFAGNQRPAFFKGNYRKAVDFGFEYMRPWPAPIEVAARAQSNTEARNEEQLPSSQSAAIVAE